MQALRENEGLFYSCLLDTRCWFGVIDSWNFLFEIYLPSSSATIIVPCVALFIVPFAIQHMRQAKDFSNILEH